jgi:hypothetical protein
MPLNPFAIVVLLLLSAALGLSVYLRRSAWRGADARWPFYAKKPLASPKQVLHQRLVTALPGHIVLSRVALTSVLGVKRGWDLDRWTPRIRRLHYDFVVCAIDSTVLAAIELSVQARDAQEPTQSDWIKERASASAGIRLIRWQAKVLPDHAEIQEIFGEPATPPAAGMKVSANQSWWPPLPHAGRSTPVL